MNLEVTQVLFLWKRELIRFWRAKSRIIGSLGMPFFFLAVLGTGLNGAINLGGFGGSYLDFIAPGILGMVLLFGSVFSGVTVIMDRQFGFLKETLVAPVRRTSIVVGKALGGATTAIIQGILMLLIAIALGAHLSWTALPLAIAIMVLISVAFVSIGIALASMMEDMHGFQLVMNFLVMPMFFLSGAIFPLNNAPAIVQGISMIDPLTYGVEALRFVLTGTSSINFGAGVAVLFVFLIAATMLAAWLFERIEN